MPPSAGSRDTAFQPAATSIGRSPRSRCWPGSPSAARTPSATPTGARRRVRGRDEAAHPGERAPRPHRSSRERHRAPRPRPRLHEGPPVDRRQQPSGPPRAGRRHPQRDHPERRRAARAAQLRPLRAADDRRLRGDLRPRRPLAERPTGPGGPDRLDGGRLARRARPRTRSSPPAASAVRSGSARPSTSSSSPRRRPRSRSSSATRASGSRKREIGDGTFLEIAGARITREERFRPDHSYRDPIALPAVRAPREGVSCLERLAVLAAAV